MVRAEVGTANRWTGTIALIAGGIFYQVSFSNLAIVLPAASASLHLSGASRGIAVAAFALGAAALFIPSGFLSVRFGTRRTLLIGLVMAGVAGVFSALSRDLSELALLRAVGGAGCALFYAPAVGLLAAQYPAPRRTLVIGLFASLSIAVGATIGFLAGAYIDLAFGWRVVLATGGAGTLATAAACVVLVPSQPGFADTGGTSADLAQRQRRLGEVLRSGMVWGLALGIAGFTTAAFLAPAFLSAYVTAVHPSWGIVYAGTVAPIAFVASVPGALAGGRWSEAGTDRRTLLGMIVILFGGLFLLIPLANEIELALLFAVLGFLFGAGLAIALTMPSFLPTTTGERTPLAVGVLESSTGFVRFGGSIAFSAIQLSAGYSWSWGVAGLLALGTTPLLLIVPPNRQAPRPERAEGNPPSF